MASVLINPIEYQLTLAGVAYAFACIGFCLGFAASAVLRRNGDNHATTPPPRRP